MKDEISLDLTNSFEKFKLSDIVGDKVKFFD